MDTYFHYYATYLAARLAGMKLPECQQLAYYCQTMSEMKAGTNTLTPWQYQHYKFTPCMTREDESAPMSIDISPSELAYLRLPAFIDTQSTIASCGRGITKANPVPSEKSITQAAIRHYYNPLTDIDWKQGGRFKAAFSKKMVEKSNPFNQPIQEATFVIHPSALLIEKQRIDSKLNSVPNSAFSRIMLNDSLYRSHYHCSAEGMPLALLGCRLFVYQNTWNIHDINELKENDEKIAPRLLQAFHWTVYAISCYLQNEVMEEHIKQPVLSESLTNMLNTLLIMNGCSLQKEYGWLSSFATLFIEHGHFSPVNWQEGLRYRSEYLLEQAMLAAETDHGRQINNLQGFKNSDFYKLNKAAQYHAQWLTGHLNSHGLEGDAEAQWQAAQNMWTKYKSKEL